MCFAPQQRALFRHLNFQKWSEPLVFLTFWLGNVLRATTACTFSTSQLPKVVRSCCVLYMLISKCASRHNGVQFFISHLASWLRTRRFSEPTFRPSGAPNHWKNTGFRDFPTFSILFAHLYLLSSCSFSSTLLSSYSFSSTLLSSNLSLLSASSLICFSSVHIVGSLTSKLPSITRYLCHSLTCLVHGMLGFVFFERSLKWLKICGGQLLLELSTKHESFFWEHSNVRIAIETLTDMSACAERRLWSCWSTGCIAVIQSLGLAKNSMHRICAAASRF